MNAPGRVRASLGGQDAQRSVSELLTEFAAEIEISD
jgi:hypothetical protein